jgi:hypothetical protein
MPKKEFLGTKAGKKNSHEDGNYNPKKIFLPMFLLTLLGVIVIALGMANTANTKTRISNAWMGIMESKQNLIPTTSRSYSDIPLLPLNDYTLNLPKYFRYCQETNNCFTPAPIDGHWLDTTHTGKQKVFLAPVCCSADWFPKNDGTPFVNPDTCANKDDPHEFHWSNSSGLANGKYQLSGGRGCYCDQDYYDPYIWQSSLLTHPPKTNDGTITSSFDPHKACALLGDRIVTFVGDSTMHQSVVTLINALIPGNCQTQIHWVQGDTLILENLGNYNRGYHWMQAYNWTHPDIMVLNAGPHVYNCSNVEKVIDQVLEGIRHLQEQPNNTKFTQFVWKTIQPGGCEFPSDISTASPDEIGQTRQEGRMYQWNWFYLYDLYAINRFHPRNNVPQGLRPGTTAIMDLRMLYSRGDAHQGIDCLHLCQPGPLDVVPVVFQNLLEHELRLPA